MAYLGVEMKKGTWRHLHKLNSLSMGQSNGDRRHKTRHRHRGNMSSDGHT